MGLLVLGALLAAWPDTPQAQQLGTQDAEAYQLKHADVSLAAEQLEQLLVGQKFAIHVDAKAKQLLVSGDASVQRVVSQFVSKLDQPKQSPSKLATTLESYNVPASEVTQRVAELTKQFPAKTGTRIVGHTSTQQVLVMATPEIHKQIRGLLLPNGKVAPTVAPKTPAIPVAFRAAHHELQLAQLNWEKLYAKLNALWGRTLPVTTTQGGTMVTVQLPSKQGQAVNVRVDRRSNWITVDGPAPWAGSWAQVIRILDAKQITPDQQTRFVPLKLADRGQVRKAMAAVQTSSAATPAQTVAVAKPAPAIPQWNQTQLAQADNAAPNTGDAPPPKAPAADGVPNPDEAPGLIGPVQIEFLEGLDVIVVRGQKRDVARVVKIINEIEQLSADTQPVVEVYPLEHVNSEATGPLVTELYDNVLSTRHGPVSITPLMKPNALLLIGRDENVGIVRDLIVKLDEPVTPGSQFHSFQLAHLAASEAEQLITDFYEERGGLGTRVRLFSDFRSNAVVVHASPRDMREVGALLKQMDVPTSEAVNQVKVFKLRHSLAEDLAPVLQEAINSQQTGGGANQQSGAVRSTMLTLMTIDQRGASLLKSGILTDAKVLADARTNSLVVTAPPESMSLISALIQQLDDLPTAESQIKVFEIINGDALSLAETLDALFPQSNNQSGQLAAQTGAGQGESSLVGLTFSIDQRTNSIIASGTAGDLKVIEAILIRLDEGDIDERQTEVYRLLNSPANDVALAINEYLRSQRDIEQFDPSLLSPFDQIEREVVVVPEPVSNSLIVSATPRYFEDIMAVVRNLDKRPAMVLIQVVLAAVRLSDTDELGVELGIQDSLLFDRSLITSSATNNNVLTPGFNFNNQQLGNSDSIPSSARQVGGQALSSFGVGRTNSSLGYGGLVLSASSESVSVLIRALQDSQRLDVLSRPQVMTLDNQPAFIQVGARVPRITSTQVTATGTVNAIDLDNVGLLLGVTPRVSPDGLVVMEIDAERSEVGAEEDGIPISINLNGDVIRSPQILTITAQTTVSARSGQTVVLGGLITKRDSTVTRRVPLVSNIPIVGALFRYDGVEQDREELLIIMTPYVLNDDEDVDLVKQVESARMSWCLADVVDLHGDVGLRSRSEPFYAGESNTIYPHLQPTGEEVLLEEPTLQDGPPLQPNNIMMRPSNTNEHDRITPAMIREARRGPVQQTSNSREPLVPQGPVVPAGQVPTEGSVRPANFEAPKPTARSRFSEN